MLKSTQELLTLYQNTLNPPPSKNIGCQKKKKLKKILFSLQRKSLWTLKKEN